MLKTFRVVSVVKTIKKAKDDAKCVRHSIKFRLKHLEKIVFRMMIVVLTTPNVDLSVVIKAL